MELKSFVKKVISDLVEAIDELDKSSSRGMHLSSVADKRSIDFDIAITTENSKDTESGGGIKVLEFVQLGGKKGIIETDSTVSRIQFGVTVNSFRKDGGDTMSQQSVTV